MNAASSLKSLLVCLVLCAATLLLPKTAEKKIPIYVFYTPSHEQLYREWFLETVPNELEVVAHKHEQECAKGSFEAAGWNRCMAKKIELVLEAIEEHWGGVFIHADVDVQFFRPFAHMVDELLGDKDIVFQLDEPGGFPCNGFFICRANERTRQLWKKVQERMSRTGLNDQRCMHIILGKFSGSPLVKVNWGLLPAKFFFGAATFKQQFWVPGRTFHIPDNPVFHHANYTVGVEYKKKQLHYVKDTFVQRATKTPANNPSKT